MTAHSKAGVRVAARPRVLVVDDEPSNRSYVQGALDYAGYEVVVAPDGPTALAVVERDSPFDLFILDLLMPKMNGDELARRLRRADPAAKVLFFTGYVDYRLAQNPTSRENEAYVGKPVTPNG